MYTYTQGTQVARLQPKARFVGTGDHVGKTTSGTHQTATAPTRWIIQEPKTTGTTANTASKFYSKNQASFEVPSKALTFTTVTKTEQLDHADNLWKFHIDSNKQWPILNLPAKIETTDYSFSGGRTQNPAIPSKPQNFHE